LVTIVTLVLVVILIGRWNSIFIFKKKSQKFIYF